MITCLIRRDYLHEVHRVRWHLVYVPHFVTHVQQDGFLKEKKTILQHSCDSLRVDVNGWELEISVCECGRVICGLYWEVCNRTRRWVSTYCRRRSRSLTGIQKQHRRLSCLPSRHLYVALAWHNTTSKARLAERQVNDNVIGIKVRRKVTVGVWEVSGRSSLTVRSYVNS